MLHGEEIKTFNLQVEGDQHVEFALVRETETDNLFAVDVSYLEQVVDVLVSPYNNGAILFEPVAKDPGYNTPEYLAERHGGVWGEYPDQPRADWQYEVCNGNVITGYWEWVASQIESGDHVSCPDQNAWETDPISTPRD
jgi:hypothetical protein